MSVTRRLGSFVHVFLFLLLAWPAAAQPPRASASSVSSLKVFVRGVQVGVEQVMVERSPDGIRIAGSGRLGPPANIVTNRCEVRYDPQWRPIEAAVDSSVNGVTFALRTRFAGLTATSQLEEGGRQSSRTDKVGPDDVVLLNAFLGLYEALAARMHAMQPGSQLKGYIIADTEITFQFQRASQERIQTPGGVVAVKRMFLVLSIPGQPAADAELWADGNGRLIRFVWPARAIEVIRDDVSLVASHRETITRPGDETVQIPANGFTLGGTVSRPSPAPPKGKRYPAVVLVSGGANTDRDEVVSEVPVFAQMASALADAGFVVVRYDKRAMGESGGRADHATIDDYADDARAALDYVRRRKDVDSKRIALVGYADGGWVTMLVAARTGQVAALALVATPGVDGNELVLQQQAHQLERRADLSPAERLIKVDLQRKINRAVMEGTGKGLEDVPAAVRKQADTPWFRSFLAFDPAKVMPRVAQSILIVQGEADREVFAAQADRLADLAHRRKGPPGKAVTVVRVPGVNHLLTAATTGEPDEYAVLADRNVSRGVLTPLVTWLQGALGKS